MVNPLSCSNINKELAWLLPLIAGSSKLKVQIFVVSKDTQDLVGTVAGIL